MAVRVYISQTQTISWPGPPSNYSPEDVSPEEVTTPEEDTTPEVDIVPPEDCEPRQITEQQRFVYESIGSVLDRLIQEAPEIEEQTESCLDYCCQACTCSLSALCSNPFSDRGSSKEKVGKVTPITPALRRGRSTGWQIMQQFPIVVKDFSRDVWIGFEVLFTLTALALSIFSFINGEFKAFNIAHFVLAVISAILAIIDAITNFIQCRTCRSWCGCCKSEHYNQCQCCPSCIKKINSAMDKGRMLLSELLFYPLLIFDMFEFIVEKPWKSKEALDIVGIIFFCISLASIIIYAYVLRTFILFYLIKFVHQQRKPRYESEKYLQKCGYDKNISKSAVWFQVYFFIHVVGQMIAQVLTLIIIGAKMQYDNRDCDDINCISVSGFLWFMLVSGYVLPVCGVLTFFIVTYYWVQEFPIGLCVDVLSLLHMPDVNTLFYPNESTRGIKKKVARIGSYLSSLKKNFRTLHNKGLSTKFLLPFRSPFLIVLSIVYSGLHLGFIICAILAFDSKEMIVPVVLNEGLGWTVSFGCAIGLEVLANIYVFAVAALWVMIIAGIILLLTLIISGLLLCCFLTICLSSDSKQRSNY